MCPHGRGGSIPLARTIFFLDGHEEAPRLGSFFLPFLRLLPGADDCCES